MRNKLEISISKKFTISCLIICLTLIFYITYSFIDQQLEKNQQIISKGATDLTLIHSEIEDSLKYATIITENIKNKIQNSAITKDNITKIFKESQTLYNSEQLKDILSISMFSWVNKSKYLSINSEFGVLENAVNLSRRDYLPLTITAPNKMHLGAPVLGAVSKQYIVPFGMGVTNKNGVYQGTIVGGFNVHKIYNQIDTTKLTTISSAQVLFNKSKDIISGLSRNKEKFLNKIDFNKKDIQLIKDFSIFNPQRAYIYKNIAHSKYGILLPLNNKYKHLLQQNYSIEIVIILSIFSSFIFFFRKTFIDPIAHLSGLVKSISKGKTDIKVPVSNITEINQLSRAVLMAKGALLREYKKNELAKKENLNKDAFLASVSHDLRNPISSIKSIIDFIESNPNYQKLNIEDKKLLLQVKEQAQDCLALTTELLDTKQSNKGTFKLEKVQEEDLKSLIDYSINLAQKRTEEKNITITTNFTTHATLLNCSAKRIKQIFSNLIDNAIKYSPSNTNINISLKKSLKNNSLICTIKDQGFGMSKEEISMALAGHGKQININGFAKTNSHGIGLPNVDQLVTLHNGDLKITSTKGKGTTVIITFPINNHLISKNDDKTITILIAEDEALNMRIIENLIQRNFTKTHIDKALDGQEAINFFKRKDKNYYDIVITDIEMPNMNGLELTEEVRKIDKTVPIIAYSLLETTDLSKDPKKIGIDDYILKKNHQELIHSLHKWSLTKYNFDHYFAKTKADFQTIIANKTILLADDEKINQTVLAKQLSKYQLQTEIVSSGEVLYEAYTQNPDNYDLIISDLHMGKLSGDQVANKIRIFEDEHNLKTIPIISNSADIDIVKTHKILRQGISDYFYKGDNIENLIKKIAFLIKSLDDQ